MFEISQAQLIETGLNVAGYLAASALSILLYSSVLNRRYRKALTAPSSNDKRLQTQTPSTSVDSRRAEIVPVGPSKDFISFNETSPMSERVENGNHSKQYSRNRAEVIRLARQMLEAGNSVERVSDLLPVSDSEMQLIRLSSGESSG